MADAQTVSPPHAAGLSSNGEPGPAMVLDRLRDPGFQRALFKRINVWMLLMWRLGLAE